MSNHIIIHSDSISHLFDTPKLVKYWIWDRESIGDLNLLNLRINVIPVKDDWILLYNESDGKDRYAKIPSQMVLMPDYMTGNPFESNEKFIEILLNNAYLAMTEKYDIRNALYGFHCGKLDIAYLLRNKSLHLSSDVLISFHQFYDYEEEFYKGHIAHCVDIFMFVPVIGVANRDFVYVPMSLFETYYNSRNPQAYLSTFSGLDYYDETSPDFRLNPEGKMRIHTAINILRNADSSSSQNLIQKKI